MKNHLGFITITIYMKHDIAEVARVLQAMVRQPLQVECFNAHLVPRDVKWVNGLDSISEPVIRLAMVGTVGSRLKLERATKALNRIVTVFKVVAEEA